MRDLVAPLVLLIACGVVFAAWPRLDIEASRFVLDGRGQFPWRDDAVVRVIHDGIDRSSRVMAAGLALALVAGMAFARALPRLAAHRRAIGYVLLVLLIGPGLIVNAALKEHWGRARPLQIAEFGGAATFSGALVPSDQCTHNCSFTSGHVAYAAMPLALAYLARTRRRRRMWLAVGIAAALAVGVMRMRMGGHFLSDVLFSLSMTWIVAAALAIAVRPLASDRDAP